MGHLAACRAARVAALSLGLLLLAGCSPASPVAVDDSVSPSTQATRSTTESAVSPSPQTVALPADLSFEAGSELELGDWETGWAESLGSTVGFSVESPDDGNGSFAYADDATGCRLSFYQGTITDLDMTKDDRTISDELLTIWMTNNGGLTPEQVAANAYDDVAAQYPGEGTVATRTIWGTGADGGSLLVSARVFGALGGGVSVTILCPSGTDAQSELNSLMGKYLAIQVEAATGK